MNNSSSRILKIKAIVNLRRSSDRTFSVVASRVGVAFHLPPGAAAAYGGIQLYTTTLSRRLQNTAEFSCIRGHKADDDGTLQLVLLILGMITKQGLIYGDCRVLIFILNSLFILI